MVRRDPGEVFFGLQDGVNIQMPQPTDGLRRALQPGGVGQGLAQHLIAAAYPQHMAPAPKMGRKINIPPLGAKGGQIGDGAF